MNTQHDETALLCYDIKSCRRLDAYSVKGDRHRFNDLAVGEPGDIYVTDTPAGAVWHLAPGSKELARLHGYFEFANGIALSPDGHLLYVSTFGDGITVLDLRSQKAYPIARPRELCLSTIDGLYFRRGMLIAIQNAFMSPRVVRCMLTHDLRGIASFEVLERRNRLFEGVTTGVVLGNEFYYMANIQDDRQSEFHPISILKLRVR